MRQTARGRETGAWIRLGSRWGVRQVSSRGPLYLTVLLLSAVFLTPVIALLLSGLASWIPAMLAAGQDPAVVLQEE